MIRTLIFRLQARLDILEAVSWYETRSAAGGNDFIQDVETTLAAVQNNPHQYQKVRGEVRRAVLQRFPYGLFYRPDENEIIVMRCLHHRRNPARWPKDD
jgi:plasmid stabilization system protein ParE